MLSTSSPDRSSQLLTYYRHSGGCADSDPGGRAATAVARAVALRKRTEAIAKHLNDFLKSTDRMAKTIVFGVDQEHADEMRRLQTRGISDVDIWTASWTSSALRLSFSRHRSC